MSRRLKTDIPGPDWRLDVDDVRAKGWLESFAPALGPPLRLVVEIGFGRGEFLFDLARRAPAVAHVGVEVSAKRVLKTARRLARTELRNVRLLQGTGELVVRELLAPASVESFWINFPDPWPKKRHAKRRLLQASFVRELAQRLVVGGVLHVATDHEPYAEAIHEVLCAEPLLHNLVAPHPYLREVDGRLRTAYELEWRAAGRDLHFFEYERRADERGDEVAISCDGDARPRDR